MPQRFPRYDSFCPGRDALSEHLSIKEECTIGPSDHGRLHDEADAEHPPSLGSKGRGLPFLGPYGICRQNSGFDSWTVEEDGHGVYRRDLFSDQVP